MALNGCSSCYHPFHGERPTPNYSTTRPDEPERPCPVGKCYCRGGELLANALSEEHEKSRAMVVTEWTCALCGAENDVWGEGAIGTWMECAKCGRETWLDFDKGLAEEL